MSARLKAIAVTEKPQTGNNCQSKKKRNVLSQTYPNSKYQPNLFPKLEEKKSDPRKGEGKSFEHEQWRLIEPSPISKQTRGTLEVLDPSQEVFHCYLLH
ncbi:hypothetical protein ES288_A08G196200v1 [Gossypium darwinii]|uniref:Uncharacterized protein n=2 Tax=Gossypium TaxID=3633 RepID=A0A5D2PK67_GOSTO|nr:hypothetical protein ES288_A08G196200v1 [Gossypium darwinii]TYI15594.1 hypothetical protein ES332_A08G197300v1 [Gossypium tomentosum]